MAAAGASVFRVDRPVPPARPPLPLRRRPDDQLPPAEEHAVHARLRLRGHGTDARRLRPRHRGRLPLLQLRRREPALPRGGGGIGVTLSWTLTAQDGRARAGVLRTAHGEVETPVFMPVGTAGTVKAMTADAVRSTGARLVLGNTYHLMLRPGAERVEALGGLHRMMDWHGPILTDSGGYQVMSLSALRSMDEDGVTFRSHIDGTRHRLTPERSVVIQRQLGADITMCLDECTPFPATEAEAAKSMRLSMRWAARCRDAFAPRDGHGLFGIVQGGVYPAARAESVEALTGIGFEGYAVGGLAVGEGQRSEEHTS